MMTITDKLIINPLQIHRCSDHTRFAMAQRAHTIECVCEDRCTGFDTSFSPLKGGITMAQSHHRAVCGGIPSEVSSTLTFWGNRNFLQQAISGRLPSIVFLLTSVFEVLRILCPFMLGRKVWAFKINALNLRTAFIASMCGNRFANLIELIK